VAALSLGESLGDRIEVVEGDFALPADQGASILPSLGEGNEVGGRRELDVEVQLLLEPGYLAQDLVAVGHELDVHVDGGRSPAVENRGRSAREIDAALHLGGSPQLAHELLYASRVG
jgi:hypothetical protein